MEIGVSLPDESSAQRLAQRLACVSNEMSVSDQGTAVRVLTEMESNHAVLQVIDTVDAWLAEDRAGAAQLSLGERSYTMFGPAGAG